MAPTATYQTGFQTEFEIGRTYSAAQIKAIIFKHFPQAVDGTLEGLEGLFVNTTQFDANSFTLDQALPDARSKIILPRNIRIREEIDPKNNSTPTICFIETPVGYVCDQKKAE